MDDTEQSHISMHIAICALVRVDYKYSVIEVGTRYMG